MFFDGNKALGLFFFLNTWTISIDERNQYKEPEELILSGKALEL